MIVIHIFQNREQAFHDIRDGLPKIRLSDEEVAQAIFIAYKYSPRKLYVVKDRLNGITGDVLHDDLPSPIADLMAIDGLVESATQMNEDRRRRFQPSMITAQEVRDYREATGASMAQARLHLMQERAKNSYTDLRQKGTLTDKVEWILDYIKRKGNL